MMTIDADLYAALAASTTLAALVGDRIYNGIAKMNVVAPFVVFQVLSSSPAIAHVGTADIAEHFVQVSCYASTQSAALAIRDAAMMVIDGAAVSAGNTGTLLDLRNNYEEAVDLYRADADFNI